MLILTMLESIFLRFSVKYVRAYNGALTLKTKDIKLIFLYNLYNVLGYQILKIQKLCQIMQN